MALHHVRPCSTYKVLQIRSFCHTHIHTHARTHARTDTHTHTRTHARTHTCTHMHARAHTHAQGACVYRCKLPPALSEEWDLLRATAVTRGWNGYRNKNQHRKLTMEKKILPPLLPGLEPETFRSRVRHSNHWAVTTPKSCLLCFSFSFFFFFLFLFFFSSFMEWSLSTHLKRGVCFISSNHAVWAIIIIHTTKGALQSSSRLSVYHALNRNCDGGLPCFSATEKAASLASVWRRKTNKNVILGK